MYNDKVNRISFMLDSYNNDEDAMFADIATTLKILTKNKEICVFEYEDGGVYLLQHNYIEREFGDLYPYWLTEDDYEEFKSMKNSVNDQDYKD